MFNKEFILNEIKRLDEMTMMEGAKLKIEISGRMTRCKGMFTYQRNRLTNEIKPVGFKFAASLLDGRYAEETVINTIRHEYAHYLANICNGKECGHGPLFMQACRYIGCKEEQYFTDRVANAEVIPERLVYVVKCECCSNEYVSARKTKVVSNVQNYRCGHCNSKLKVTQEMRRV